MAGSDTGKTVMNTEQTVGNPETTMSERQTTTGEDNEAQVIHISQSKMTLKNV